MIPKALILDRDGTLIEHVPYLSDPARMVLLPGVRDGLDLARRSGAKLFLHTNQSGVGRGFFTMREVERCNARLIEMLGDVFTAICCAPEAPGQLPAYRKPSPAFAREVMAAHGFAAGEICYVGDRGSDLATAAAAGTQGVGVATGLDDLSSELEALGFGGRFPVFGDFLTAMKSLFPQP